MRAVEFIRKFGVDKARDEVALHGWLNTGFWIQLKRYVEAYELVNSYKGSRGIRFRIRFGMFRYGDSKELNNQLKQAIQLVEEVESE